MRTRRYLWSVLIFVIAGLTLLLVMRSLRGRLMAERGEVLPVLGRIDAFTMSDEMGRTVTATDLRGKVWVAQFFFTACPGPCPAVSLRLAELQGMLKWTRDVRIVSISIDPEDDTPAALQAYARRAGANPSRWLFLVGTPAMTDQLVTKEFMIGFQPNSPAAAPTQGRFVHSTKVALVDSMGQIRAYYDGLDAEMPSRALLDIGLLLREEHLQ